MSIASLPPVILASIAFYVGAYHLVVYWRQRHPRENLTFGLCCLCITAYDIFCAGLYSASSPQEGVYWQTFQSIGLNLGAIAFLWFTVDFTRWKPIRLVWALTLLYLPFIAISLISPYPLLWTNQPHVRTVSLPFGLSVTYQEMLPGPINLFTGPVAFLIFGFALWAGIRLWRRGDRRRATPLIVTTCFFFAGVFNDIAVTSDLYSFVYLIEYTFLAPVVLMAYTLSNELISAALVKQKLRQSEELLRNTLHSTADGLLVVDQQRHILVANPRFAQMWGIPKETLDTTSDAHQLVEITQQQLLDPESIREQIEATTNSDREHVDLIRFKDGRLYEQYCSPLIREGIQIGRIFSFRDRTEVELAQEALRESEANYHLLFEAETDAIVTIDVQSRIITDANPAALRLLGYGREELVGQPATILAVRPDQGAPFLAMLERDDPEALQWFIAHQDAVRAKNGTSIAVEVSIGQYTVKDRKTICAIIRDITERQEAEREREQLTENLKKTTALLEGVLNAIPDIIGVQDADQQMILYNEAGYRFLDLHPEQIRGKRCFELIGRTTPCKICATKRAIETRQASREEKYVEEMGIWVDARSYPLLDEQGNIIQIIEHLRDITREKQAEVDRTRLEEQLEQSRKLEAIGRLAGGVAHDFNNILTSILGYTEMVLADFDPDHPHRQNLEEVVKAGQSATQLTSQLLTFSRKQIIAPRLLWLNEAVAGAKRMLERIIGEDIVLSVRSNPALWPVKADPGQIEQILINLAANARDAMPSGGELTIETENVTVDEAYLKSHPESSLGDYVLLTVSDTGIGMDADTRQRIFEPFFSTKQKGRGTGLGLPTVYGIVQQNKGIINVRSEPRAGTTFEIYLPRVKGEQVVAPPPKPTEPFDTGDETILLVEDESTVRTLANRMLQRLGYQVIEASDSRDALEIAKNRQGVIHLLVTDIVMPGMNGWDLFLALRSLRPGVKVLFISGYPENVIAHHGVLKEGTHFLPKPFKLEVLARKIREALAAS
ncbi:MAG: PAS domain S-box protein [Bradymonadales bacterium]|nr:PAS domain S-box protein [Bradymonadales bacterium]